jgi:hypothetical protein
MHACAAGYALTYVTTLKLQLVSWKVVGLTAAKSLSQGYFSTGGLPPLSSSWRQAP